MNLKKLKLFAIAAFLAFASAAFLFSNGENTQAQTSKTADNRDEVLEKVADYKTWKQVQKPEKISENGLKTNTFSISDSAVAG